MGQRLLYLSVVAADTRTHPLHIASLVPLLFGILLLVSCGYLQVAAANMALVVELAS